MHCNPCSRDRGDTLDSCSDVEVHARIGLRMYLRQSRGLSCAARKTVVKRTFENPFRASYPINLFCKSLASPPLPSFQNYRQRFQAFETFSCMLLQRSRPAQRRITQSRCFFRLSPAAPLESKSFLVCKRRGLSSVKPFIDSSTTQISIVARRGGQTLEEGGV